VAHDVFISHANEDKTIADMVCATLEQEGIRCWIAPRDIRPGDEWGRSIVGAIKGSSAMVLVFSDHANASRHIPREVERAVDHAIPVIPFRIENVMPGDSLEYSLSSVHWLDAFSPPIEAHIKRLAQTLRSILPEVPARAVKVAVPEPAVPVVAPPPTAPPAAVEPPAGEAREETVTPVESNAATGMPKQVWMIAGVVIALVVGIGFVNSRMQHRALMENCGALADIYQRQKTCALAVNEFEASGKGSELFRARLDLAAAESGAGDKSAAIYQYTRALAMPESSEMTARLLRDRGVAYADLGNRERAVADLSDAIKLNPPYLFDRGEIYVRFGQDDLAVKDFTEVNKDPNFQNLSAYEERGHAEFRKENYYSALADYDRATRGGNSSITAWYAAGCARLWNRDRGGAADVAGAINHPSASPTLVDDMAKKGIRCPGDK